MTYHIDTVLSTIGAAFSTGALWLAQVAPPAIEPWVQVGGTIGLIGFLSTACVSMWNANQKLKDDMKDLNKEIRTDWKEQNSKLIQVLEKLDPDK